MTLIHPLAADAGGARADRSAYPIDLARLVLARWDRAQSVGHGALAAPTLDRLTEVLSVAYQATLLREESRPVTFRLALSAPHVFASAAGPPAGLHRLIFNRPLPLDQHELRRLAPAAVFARSLIGVTLGDDSGEQIWGLIHSGPHWLQSVRGGRATDQSVPHVLIVAATGPGQLLVSAGSTTLAVLRNGTLSTTEMDVFQSAWMARKFGAVLATHVLRRILATVRAAQHGGTLIIVPAVDAPGLFSRHYLRAKYAFIDEEPRRRILTLMSDIMAELPPVAAGASPLDLVEWDTYETSHSSRFSELDEALFEVAHLVADLTRIDGTVVMTDSLDILGFGVEIAGELPEVEQVARASDLEGHMREWVRTDRVGTRHRSAYRLCQAVHEALGLVVSQDGTLRFIRWHDDGVTYWEQAATGVWDV